MKNLFIGVIVGMCLMGVAMAAESLYSLRAVVNFPDDAVQCFKDGGKAAQVGELNEAGFLIDEMMMPFCLIPEK